MMRFHAVWVVFLLAGCSDAPPPEPDVPAPAMPTADVIAATGPWSYVAAIGTPNLAANLVPAQDASLAVRVPPNATLLEARAEGTCTSGPVCALEFLIRQGQSTVARGAVGDLLRIEDPVGDYELFIWPPYEPSVVVEAQGVFYANVTVMGPAR